MLLVVREAKHTYFIVFGLTLPELEPTIYTTLFVQANYDITDAVWTQNHDAV
jgi:hypothetical protein